MEQSVRSSICSSLGDWEGSTHTSTSCTSASFSQHCFSKRSGRRGAMQLKSLGSDFTVKDGDWTLWVRCFMLSTSANSHYNNTLYKWGEIRLHFIIQKTHSCAQPENVGFSGSKLLKPEYWRCLVCHWRRLKIIQRCEFLFQKYRVTRVPKATPSLHFCG